MYAGIDFGLSVTDAVLLDGARPARHASRFRPGPASEALLAALLGELGAGELLQGIGVTGGRARELPATHQGVPVRQIDEPAALGRGGLALAGCERALVVSCGTGTAMVLADAVSGSYHHVAGTPVGGGTLSGLGSLLLGTSDAFEITDLALTGDASAVDTTLGDVLGGSLGHLPASATAVSFGRLATGNGEPTRADLAASLTTMVAQTIGFIALGAARAHGVDRVVLVGRLAERPAIGNMIAAVLRVFQFPTAPTTPAGAGHATALGAALLASEA